MEAPTPIHVVAPEGPERERLARSVGAVPGRVHATCGALDGANVGERAAVVLGSEVPLEDAWALSRRVADRELCWILLRAEEDVEGVPVVRPFSVGFPVAAEALESRASRTGGDGPLLELHEILRVLSRIRHDINNPLTAGLAETQLLLMDKPDDDQDREALETIERQFRRIQAMVRDDLTRLRRPR